MYAWLLVSHLRVIDTHILTSVSLICQPGQGTKVNKMVAKWTLKKPGDYRDFAVPSTSLPVLSKIKVRVMKLFYPFIWERGVKKCLTLPTLACTINWHLLHVVVGHTVIIVGLHN